MKSMYSKILFKKHQWFLQLIILTFVGIFSTFIANGSDVQQFTCTQKHVVDYINSLISFDKDIMEHYLGTMTRGELTDDHKLELVTILMQYHLLPLDESNQRVCEYYQYWCFSRLDTVHHYARRYLNRQADGGSYCVIGTKKQPLLSDACKREIKKRIQPIPYPLAIAQASLESSWGRSNFSQNNQNYFGLQKLFSSEERVMTNDQCTPAGKNTKNCVYHFKSAETGFFVYSQILNSRPAYRTLREIRYQNEAHLRHNPCKLAEEMANGLESYATDTQYLQKIKTIIKNICSLVNNC